jgi:tetratricopeptide (TPR) repeat protein
MTPRFVAILATLVLPLAASADAARSRALNTEGFRQYKAGAYEEAVETFRKAVAESPENALAHYNLASTIAVLSRKDPCSHMPGEALDELEKAVQLDAGRRERMKVDPDLEPLRRLFGYFKLLGLSTTATADVQQLLVGVGTWYGPAPGIYGPIYQVEFNPGGKLTLSTMQLGGDGTPARRSISGRYEVSGSAVQLQLDRPYQGKRKLEGTLSEEGAIQFGEGGPEPLTPSDSSACGA